MSFDVLRSVGVERRVEFQKGKRLSPPSVYDLVEGWPASGQFSIQSNKYRLSYSTANAFSISKYSSLNVFFR